MKLSPKDILNSNHNISRQSQQHSYLSFPPRTSRTPPRAPSHSPCSWSLFRTPLWWGFPTYMARTCLMFFLILSHVFLRMHDVRLFHVIHRLHIMFSTYPTHIWLTHHTHFYISIISNVLRLVYSCWSSPRPISIIPLNTLLCLHSWPIYHVVFMGSYPFLVGYLILGWVSRLDAFSVYLFRTSLPSYAIGITTGSQLVRPSRSSRTKDSSLQISSACDR